MKKLPSLNGLRALSILMVINFHYFNLHPNSTLFSSLQTIRWTLPIFRIICDGIMGVSIFFVISGFLITSLLLHEEKKNGSISFKTFYVKRILRIFPAYYFLLITYILLRSIGILHFSTENLLSSLFYISNFNSHLDWIFVHTWSLSLEEQFYIFWPFVFMLGKRSRLIIILILAILPSIIRTYANYKGFGLQGYIRIDAIAVGCLCAIKKEQIIRLQKPYWKIVFLASCALLLSLRFIPSFISIPYINIISSDVFSSCGILSNVLIAIIVLYSVYAPPMIWFKILNLKILNQIGVLSYSLYLWQEICVSTFNNFAICLIALFSVALFSYYVIEKPILKIKQRMFSR